MVEKFKTKRKRCPCKKRIDLLEAAECVVNDIESNSGSISADSLSILTLAIKNCKRKHRKDETNNQHKVSRG